MAYYEKALKVLLQHRAPSKYFIFGDENGSLRNIMKGLPAYWINKHNQEKGQDYRDMQLMSLCSNIIIANSSFSWWAAYLGDYRNKLVLAPSPWLPMENLDDIVCASWLKICYKK